MNLLTIRESITVSGGATIVTSKDGAYTINIHQTDKLSFKGLDFFYNGCYFNETLVNPSLSYFGFRIVTIPKETATTEYLLIPNEGGL